MKSYTAMFTITLFYTVKRWKQLNCSSMDELINNEVYIDNGILPIGRKFFTCYSTYESSGHYAK